MIFLSKNSSAVKHKYGNKGLERGRALVNISCIPKHIFIHDTSSQNAMLKILPLWFKSIQKPKARA